MFTEGVLPQETKELIAVYVARDAHCGYSIDAHVLFLDLIGASPKVAAAVREVAVDDMPVDEKVRELLRFVQRIDHDAYKMVDAEVDRLREMG
jgi:AhpD family alkylhydroperoxidase